MKIEEFIAIKGRAAIEPIAVHVFTQPGDGEKLAALNERNIQARADRKALIEHVEDQAVALDRCKGVKRELSKSLNDLLDRLDVLFEDANVDSISGLREFVKGQKLLIERQNADINELRDELSVTASHLKVAESQRNDALAKINHLEARLAGYKSATQTLKDKAGCSNLADVAAYVDHLEGRKLMVYDWAYREDGKDKYARTPEKAEQLAKQGVKLTPVYVPFDEKAYECFPGDVITYRDLGAANKKLNETMRAVSDVLTATECQSLPELRDIFVKIKNDVPVYFEALAHKIKNQHRTSLRSKLWNELKERLARGDILQQPSRRYPSHIPTVMTTITTKDDAMKLGKASTLLDQINAAIKKGPVSDRITFNTMAEYMNGGPVTSDSEAPAISSFEHFLKVHHMDILSMSVTQEPNGTEWEFKFGDGSYCITNNMTLATPFMQSMNAGPTRS